MLFGLQILLMMPLLLLLMTSLKNNRLTARTNHFGLLDDHDCCLMRADGTKI